jgi:hypothetical protein
MDYLEAIPVDILLAEAEIEVAHNCAHLDDSLANHLESVARNTLVPVRARERAISILCQLE